MPSQEQRNIVTVKDLTRAIKQRLELDPGLQQIWVRGEISNFKHHSSGHMYFTLKDETSRIRAIMFRSYNQRISFIPREGTAVLALGNVSVYERDGQYQFYVQEMQPDGIGSLYLAYEQLKDKLDKEGLFSQAYKKQLPSFPHTIAVLTSPTGAAVRDMVTTLRRRFPAVRIYLYPIAVQGKQAAPSIVAALEQVNRHQAADVILLGRGGGSLEELWAFNEEEVARAVFASHIPVIAAVGHETDFTIAEFVADLRAATPTAAAELAVPHHLELKQQQQQWRQRLQRSLMQQLQNKRDKLRSLQQSSCFKYPERHLLESAERLDRLRERLKYGMRELAGRSRSDWMKMERRLSAYNPMQQITYSKKRRLTIERQLSQAFLSMYRQYRLQLNGQLRQLDALSPLKVMQRGYSVIYDEQQKTIINRLAQVQPGDMIKVKLTDGELDCHVWSMKGEEADG